MSNTTLSAKTFLCLALLLLAGCEPMTRQASEQTAASAAGELQYFKDRHGICYALLGSASYGFYTVASITAVSCEKVGL